MTGLSGLWTRRRAETSADFANVVIPLDEAHLHSHSYRAKVRSGDSEGQLDENAFEGDVGGDDGGLDKDGDDEGTGMLLMGSTVPEYSIEGLRREVRRGGRGKKWTDYESECLKRRD